MKTNKRLGAVGAICTISTLAISPVALTSASALPQTRSDGLLGDVSVACVNQTAKEESP
ncbi:hypothetical protein ACFLSG_01355 [Candidatus Bipolaricaulota bacterium]